MSSIKLLRYIKSRVVETFEQDDRCNLLLFCLKVLFVFIYYCPSEAT